MKAEGDSWVKLGEALQDEMVGLQEEIQTCQMYNEQITQDLTRKRLQDTNILLQ